VLERLDAALLSDALLNKGERGWKGRSDIGQRAKRLWIFGKGVGYLARRKEGLRSRRCGG